MFARWLYDNYDLKTVKDPGAADLSETPTSPEEV